MVVGAGDVQGWWRELWAAAARVSPWVGAESRALGVPELTVGILCLFLSFLGAGWAISLPCCQEVEVSLEGLPRGDTPRLGVPGGFVPREPLRAWPGVACPASCTHAGSPQFAG